MRLLVGLGNPGPTYARNRHNIGFMAVDAFAEHHGFPAWRQRFQGFCSEGVLGGEKVLLLKPMTYMNKSGQSVGEAARFYKLSPEDILVFHDELDLGCGKVKLKTGGGHAGHNGLRSIIAHLGADFRRARLGIGHPGDKAKVHGHVLGDFSKSEQEIVDRLLEVMAREAPLLLAGDARSDGAFMSKVSQAVQPARDRQPSKAKATTVQSDKGTGQQKETPTATEGTEAQAAGLGGQDESATTLGQALKNAMKRLGGNNTES
ncbi:aminoacyl-tRNA hydrolase [Fodinicurvata sediminis]|uniref:aminoacyl-tRNA hydrolase n=1 Tax=Fodinicurvata sediminis TaxID=1121832 RepID=UPI0003B5B758|nr:aminoacyl-tRNA hydrolase [Fodinicurvata sediminis]